MDEDIKIQALMVYFKYWGIEEAQKTRLHQGISLLNNKIHHVFLNDGQEHTSEELVSEVNSFNTWTKMNNPRPHLPPLWYHIIDVLLESIGGCSFDNNQITPSRESIVSRNVKMKVWAVYDMCLSDEDLMSVDSIVALL